MSYNVSDLSVKHSRERKGKERDSLTINERQAPQKIKLFNHKQGFLFLVLSLFLFSSIWAQTDVCLGCPGGIDPEPSLILNGDFETGTYTIPPSAGTYPPIKNCGPMGPGQYCITTEPTIQNAGWISSVIAGNHGKFLVCDGFGNKKTKLFEQTLTVKKNSTYIFCAWFTNLFRRSYGTPPTVEVRITANNNTSLLSLPLTLTNTSTTWHSISGSWSSGNNTTATVQVFLLAASTSLGNDIAMDNISFSRCRHCTCGEWAKTTVNWCSPFFPYLNTRVIPGCDPSVLTLCSVCVCSYITLTFDYRCKTYYPPLCTTTYSWRVTGPNGFFKSGTANPCRFIPTMPGLYTIHIKTLCDDQECCPACTINLEVMEIVQCEHYCHPTNDETPPETN